MVDSLLFNKAKADQSQILGRLGLTERGYALLTLHRPGNVDDEDSLTNIMTAITEISERVPVVFPAHPRTQKKLRDFKLDRCATMLPSPNEAGAWQSQSKVLITPPVSYLDFLKLEMYARFALTDSGGIQEETTVLGVPCLTLRDTTERPITVAQGTNVVVGNNRQSIVEEASKVLAAEPQSRPRIELWDGRTAERIVEIIVGREYNDIEEGGIN